MSLDVEQQQQPVRAPAQPSYIFRGHTAHVHSVQIVHRNTCLLSGDADGWVVCWKLETKRPLAVWKAHDAAILGTAEWRPDKIITHGRDNALRIWQLKADDASYSTVLPADGADTHRPKPWLLHSLPVNTLNFCAFTMCYQRPHSDDATGRARSDRPTGSSEPIYIAVPGRDDKKAEVYQFPDERLICVVSRVDSLDTGMVMALKLTHHQPSNNVLVIAGYEGGFTATHLVPRNTTEIRTSTLDLARTIYLSRPHTQPILSVDSLPDGTTYFTSSADAIIAAHRIPNLPTNTGISDTLDADLSSNASHTTAINGNRASDANQSDPGSIEGTTNPNSTTPTTSPISKDPNPGDSIPTKFTSSPSPEALSFPKTRPSGLSSLLASAPPRPPPRPAALPTVSTPQPAYKTTNTKHAGQQSLRVRSDGRLLVTAGWDARIRVYSATTLREVAVLKWHKEGAYAAGFGEVFTKEDLERDAERGSGKDGEVAVAKRETGLAKLQRQREQVVKGKRWVVGGAKDGRVSLWEVF